MHTYHLGIDVAKAKLDCALLRPDGKYRNKVVENNLKGFNAHHQAETIFKAFGRALRMALEFDPRMAGQMPSTKGVL